MSDAPLIAFVVEGNNDYIMLMELTYHLLGGKDFEHTFLQPEKNEIEPKMGVGWPGVYRWCRSAYDQSKGRFRNHPIFDIYDLLIIHLDADVAENNYSDGHIDMPVCKEFLPCVEPCPPPSATTDRLRQALLCWLGEKDIPPKIVFCIPSKSLDTWILVGLHSGHRVVKRGNIECRDNPKTIFKGLKKQDRLFYSDPEKAAPRVADNWSIIKEHCTEAARFENDFMKQIS